LPVAFIVPPRKDVSNNNPTESFLCSIDVNP